jgi:hypothetical protein
VIILSGKPNNRLSDHNSRSSIHIAGNSPKVRLMTESRRQPDPLVWLRQFPESPFSLVVFLPSFRFGSGPCFTRL